MKLSKVYEGCTKDGKERVFLKSFDSLNNCTVFIDLETKERFTYVDVDINSLVPYGNRVSNRKRSSRRKVIKTYKTEKNILLHVDNLFLGNKCIVKWISSPYVARFYSENMKPMAVRLRQKNILFVKINESEYKELSTSQIFKVEGNSELNIGDICVNNLKNAKQELNLSKNELVSKNKALRLYYCKFKSRK